MFCKHSVVLADELRAKCACQKGVLHNLDYIRINLMLSMLDYFNRRQFEIVFKDRKTVQTYDNSVNVFLQVTLY